MCDVSDKAGALEVASNETEAVRFYAFKDPEVEPKAAEKVFWFFYKKQTIDVF